MKKLKKKQRESLDRINNYHIRAIMEQIIIWDALTPASENALINYIIELESKNDRHK